MLPFAPYHPDLLVFATTKFCINLCSIIVVVFLQTPLWQLFCKLYWCNVVLVGDRNSCGCEHSKEVYYDEMCLHLLPEVVGGVWRLVWTIWGQWHVFSVVSLTFWFCSKIFQFHVSYLWVNFEIIMRAM